VSAVVARVTNDAGRTFNVRLVRQGDRYGLGDALTHDDADPLVEFWDATHEHDPRFTPGLGQFVSRYYLRTLTTRPPGQGLALVGHVAAWSVTAANVTDAIAAVNHLRHAATLRQ
jgi:hypothetical protein